MYAHVHPNINNQLLHHVFFRTPSNSFYNRFYWLAEPGQVKCISVRFEDVSHLKIIGHTHGQEFSEQWKCFHRCGP